MRSEAEAESQTLASLHAASHSMPGGSGCNTAPPHTHSHPQSSRVCPALFSRHMRPAHAAHILLLLLLAMKDYPSHLIGSSLVVQHLQHM